MRRAAPRLHSDRDCGLLRDLRSDRRDDLEPISSALEAREILVEQDIQRSARVTLGKLQRELELAFSHRTRNTLSDGLHRTRRGAHRPGLVRLLSHQRLYQNARESDQTEITIRVRPIPRRSLRSCTVSRSD